MQFYGIYLVVSDANINALTSKYFLIKANFEVLTDSTLHFTIYQNFCLILCQLLFQIVKVKRS